MAVFALERWNRAGWRLIECYASRSEALNWLEHWRRVYGRETKFRITAR